MTLSFKQQFKEKILNGSKIHTIREDKSNRWKAGNIIHFATGVRTKSYECFATGKCVSVQEIEIIRVSDYANETIIKVDERALPFEEIQKLAWNDGFHHILEFWLWFNRDFKGKIIHWTDFKYGGYENQNLPDLQN
ncbi:MAG: ASCH domain-containing protein [Flavobacteriaceae bacterium]|jgi:uncharacterized protein YqfB (UPF0267 family)|nr:ASCH domain-containing protein [Flavobacteriaceae bacterium]